jgi:hypothetical protein
MSQTELPQMKTSRLVLSVVLSAVCLTLGSAATHAQLGAERIRRPINTPTFSPYLNMFRRGDNSGPALNYYGLVRPQMQFDQQNQQLGRNIQQLQIRQSRQQQGAGARYPSYSRLGITGHPVVFQSFNSGAQTGLRGSTGGGLTSFGGGASIGGGTQFGAFSGGGGSSFTNGGLPGTGFSGNTSGGRGFGSGFTGHPATFGSNRGSIQGGFGSR